MQCQRFGPYTTPNKFPNFKSFNNLAFSVLFATTPVYGVTEPASASVTLGSEETWQAHCSDEMYSVGLPMTCLPTPERNVPNNFAVLHGTRGKMFNLDVKRRAIDLSICGLLHSCITQRKNENLERYFWSDIIEVPLRCTTVQKH